MGAGGKGGASHHLTAVTGNLIRHEWGTETGEARPWNLATRMTTLLGAPDDIVVLRDPGSRCSPA